MSDTIDHESVAWPSYVDFLSAFIFVLLLLVAILLTLASGDFEQRAFEANTRTIRADLNKNKIPYVVEGHKYRISLEGQVTFVTNTSDLDQNDRDALEEFGKLYIAKNELLIHRIIIEGHADRQAPRDPFRNWQLSADRAVAVLRFLYLCNTCGYGESVREKLTLSGQGELDASAQKTDNPNDRRVDIILDFGRSK
jgi:flagellar motor protein MotB